MIFKSLTITSKYFDFKVCFSLQFKVISHANTILSNPSKRQIYDEYGNMGLYIAEQFGDEVLS